MSNTPPSAVTPPASALAPAAATPAAITVGSCANCGTPGTGRYCGSCGQRLDVHMHSVGHFVSEAAEVLTHSDSSLWKTLWPLLAKPGELTREFIAGRRARYLQPFRLYLVASVLLLLATGLGGRHASQSVAAAIAPAATHSAATPAAAARSAAAGTRRAAVSADAADIDVDGDGNDAGHGRKEADTGAPEDCNHITSDARWMQPFIPALTSTCRSMLADSGRELVNALIHNAGRAMFVFLPLLAAIMKLLYWRPRRYYLEHLLLLLHNHAFIYLFFALFLLVAHVLPDGWIASLLGTAAVLYALRYLYKSMRNYYGQGRALTLAKFTALAAAYCVAGFATAMLTAFVTAVTL